MIALDTNLIVRVVTRDDPEQAEAAARLMKKHRLWLPKTVLLETEWVLRHTYRLPVEVTQRTLRSLVGLTNLQVEDPVVVSRALGWHEEGLDFADALHLASSSEARSFVTLDRQLIHRARDLEDTPSVEHLDTE